MIAYFVMAALLILIGLLSVAIAGVLLAAARLIQRLRRQSPGLSRGKRDAQ